MKSLKLRIFLPLIFFATQSHASLCTPEYLEQVSNRVAAQLFCALLPEEHIEYCSAAAFTIGVSSLVASLVLTGKADKLAIQSATPLRTERIHRALPTEARRILVNNSGASFDYRELIRELRRHPRLFHNNISLLRSSSRWEMGSRYVRRLGLVGLFFAYIVTNPDDCPSLTWDDVQNEDNQWISFGGVFCSKYINPDFFELPLEEQYRITERSPKLCKLISRANRDLEETQQQSVAEDSSVSP